MMVLNINKVMRNVMLLSALLTIIACACHGATIKKVPGKADVLEMSNELLTVKVALDRGARVVSFCYKGFDDQDVIYDYENNNGGMFKDLWTVQGWPGEFDRRLFEHEIVKAGPDEVILKTWTMSTGIRNNKVKEMLSNLLLTKTYILRKGERALHVVVEITNKDSVGKRPAYWVQNALDFDGQRKNNQYWRPTRHGVDMISKTVNSEYGYWYVAIPRAGWNGITNPKLKRGIMFLMDYNNLEQLYDNCAANTLEWMYVDTAIPAGKTWRTEITAIPTEGYAGYRHADKNLVADFKVNETPAGLLVTHVLSAAGEPLHDITINTSVVGAVQPWKATGEEKSLSQFAFAPQTPEVLIKNIGALPAVIKVKVAAKTSTGENVTIKYEDYYGGKMGRNLNLELLEPYYEFKAPPKQPQYLKPDVIKLAENEKPRVLFIKGLWGKFQGMDEALEKRPDCEVTLGWMKKTALGESISSFPADYNELLSYDAIILANISGGMLGDIGQEMLADYLKAGGGLLLLSGDRTFGQAEFANKNFLSLMPVKFAEKGDYGRLKAPSRIMVDGNDPLANGVNIPAGAVVLYRHKFASIAAGARTPLKYQNSEPLVVLMDNKPGRVGVVSALPFGEAPQGKHLYFNDPQWHEFLARLLDWSVSAKR